MRIRDWSSDGGSADLDEAAQHRQRGLDRRVADRGAVAGKDLVVSDRRPSPAVAGEMHQSDGLFLAAAARSGYEIGRESCRARVSQDALISVGEVSFKTKIHVATIRKLH